MISLNSIEFSLPTKIIFGNEVVDRIGEIAKDYTDKVFILADRKLVTKIGLLQKVENILDKSGVSYIIYDEIDRDPENDVVDELGTLIRQSRVKLVIGIGGTSVINAAKAACYLAENKGKISEFLNGGLGKDASVPLIVIPTIPSINQQLNDEFILKDHHDNIKKSI